MAKHRVEFSYASFLTKEEILQTISKIHLECDKLFSVNMFLISNQRVVITGTNDVVVTATARFDSNVRFYLFLGKQGASKKTFVYG